MGKKGPEDLQTHIYWIPESFLFENESTQKYAVVPSSALAEIMLVILKGPVLYHDVQIQLSISGISLSIDLIFAINPWMIQHQVCTLTPYLHTVRLNNPSKVHIIFWEWAINTWKQEHIKVTHNSLQPPWVIWVPITTDRKVRIIDLRLGFLISIEHNNALPFQ